jgi:hypothetical protein
MTRDKKLKKAVRARARKTGERYTAARRQVLLAREKRGRATPPPGRPAPATAPVSVPGGRAAGSDAAVVRKTGHGLAHWFAVLDRFDAAAKGHTASAAHLNAAHGVPGWHAQMITVAYERARGRRAPNQASSGRFQVSVSKSVPGTVAEVAAAIGDARRRAQWLRAADRALVGALDAALAGENARRVTIKKEDYGRLRYPWDGAAVEIFLYGKPKGRTSVVANNTDLPDAATVEERRRQWRAALDGLKAHLAG